MFDFSSMLTFVVVVLGLFLVPGPAVLLVFTSTAQGGRKVGVMTGLGIATGDFIHTVCAAVGLSAVLMTSALAFTVIKVVGAAYLIYLGIRAILAKQGDAVAVRVQPMSPVNAYLQAVPAELLNPKTALFFLAFMPQFVDPSKGSALLQFGVLGLVFVVMSSLYTTCIAFSVRPLGRLLKNLSCLQRWQGKIIGSMFIGLGLKLAFQQR